jgi:hypothetical protein
LVQLIVTSATGCKDSIQKSILVQPAPKPIFSVVGGNAICSSKDLTIRVSNVSIAKGIPQHTWSIRNTESVNTFATVSSATATQPSFRIPDNTSLVDSVYEIKLMLTTTDGCIADTVVNLLVHPRPSSSIVLSSLANCGNTNFIATASNMATIKSNVWSWSANSPNAPTPIVSISNNIARFILPDNVTQQSIVYQVKVLDTTSFGCRYSKYSIYTLS